jgi:hypothetical protein
MSFGCPARLKGSMAMAGAHAAAAAATAVRERKSRRVKWCCMGAIEHDARCKGIGNCLNLTRRSAAEAPMLSMWKLTLAVLFALVLAPRADGARLINWATDPNGPFFFRLQCGSNEVHLVQRSTNLVDWATWMRSAGGGTNRYIEVPQSVPRMRRDFFRTLQTNEPAFAYGLAATSLMDLNNNNLSADSFDSANPVYSTNGRWDISKRRDRAHIAVGAGVTNVSNLMIHGNCYRNGPEVIDIGPNGAIGTVAWHAAQNHAIQPGHFSTDWPVPHSEVALPAGSEGWLPMPPGGMVNGGFVNYLFNQPGDYRMPAGTLSGKVYVSANVRLRIDGSINFTGQDGIFIASNNASLTLYMNGASAALTGQGIINPFKPTNFVYFGTPANTSLQIGGNGEMTAALYAPSTVVTLHGGGNSDQDFSGALIANSIRLMGHYQFHFDEDLLHLGPPW